MTDDLLLLALALVGVLVLVLIVLCVVLTVILLRSRRAPAAAAAPSPLPQGPDVGALDEVDITRVAPFLPSLLGDDEAGNEEDAADEESKAILHFEDDSWLGVDEPTGPTPLIVTSSAGRTDRGIVRRRNEDAFLVDEALDLYVVADGMGGSAGGDIASKMAVEAVRAWVASPERVQNEPNYPRRGGEIKAAVEHANSVILAEAHTKKQLEGMGTTLLVARFSPRKQRVYIGHVGDSRAYRLRRGSLQMLTSDHTLAARGVTGPLASNIRRALGIAPKVKVDVIVDTPLPNDVYLFCTDGLNKMVEDDQIRRVLQQEGDLSRTVTTLLAAANAKGGRDNTTVILVRVREVVINSWGKPGEVAHA
jgi:protein phosphatase